MPNLFSRIRSTLSKKPSKTNGNEQEGTNANTQETLAETTEFLDEVATTQGGDGANITGVNKAAEALNETTKKTNPKTLGKLYQTLSSINIKELPKNMQDKFKETKKKLKELPKKLKEEKTKVKTKVTHAGSNNKARVQSLQDAIVLFVKALAQDKGMNLLDHLFSAQNQGISVKPTQNTKERVVSFTPSKFYTSYLDSKELTETAQKLAGLKKSSVGKWYNNMVEHVTSPQTFKFATLDQNSKIGPLGADNYQKTTPIKYLNKTITP